ncbi:Uma2 family endonuclease [Allocatelliglobosispora scoriae]|uniref:Uma2 family endonuclease n=1 Tax=Allocatelliglobosispora scoriae TaxID=643052 RepID=A0A841BV14_9ACTN|nr:Uma2 family endonuclease [Allocatelliglobosispora scoriae]MBB5871525.1 Uma2 family endonuclease [Allocatelliglobosispora scoriae]
MDQPGRLLTIDDLDAIPYDGKRYELIDGVLHVSPAPTHPHQAVSGFLFSWLFDNAPDGMTAAQAIDMHVSRFKSFIPDVLVAVRAGETRDSPVTPAEVLLAVEIVSPGSRPMDRVRKPRHYAQAGIECFWRIEQEPELTVHTYTLDHSTGTYLPTGSFTEVVAVERPWPIKLPVALIDPGKRRGAIRQ